MNDGLALPFVLICLSVIGHYEARYAGLALELLLGIAIGVIVPLVACWLRTSPFVGVAKPFEPLFAVAIGLLVLAISSLTHANIYLAAFAAGVTIASTRPALREEFHRFGELITELLSWPRSSSSARSYHRIFSTNCTRLTISSRPSRCFSRDPPP